MPSKPPLFPAELRRHLKTSLPANSGSARDAQQPAFDRLLAGGVRPRRLVDILAATAGSGAGLLGLWLCAQACNRRGELVVVDPDGVFYPPAAAAWGVDARRLLVVSPRTKNEALAVVEQSLRSPAAGAVWAMLEQLNGKAYRRLLLAAESGAAFGALVRPARFHRDPSWADVQLRVHPLPVAAEPGDPLLIHVEQTRNRHGPASGEATLAIDWRAGRIEEATQQDEPTGRPTTTNPLPLAAGLAGAAQSA